MDFVFFVSFFIYICFMELTKTEFKYPLRVLMTKQEFTVIEKRIFLKAFAQIQTGWNVQQDFFKETIEVYLNYSDFEKENWTTVKKSLDKLVGRTIKPIDDKSKFDGLPWLARATAERNKGITIKFNREANEILMELSKGYTKLQLDLMMTLGSEYSQRLYEQLSHWSDIGRKEPFELDYVRDLIGVPSSYNLSKLRERVLDYSKKELAEKTNIVFDYELIKFRSRSFNYIQFFIKNNNVEVVKASQAIIDFDTLDEKSQRCYDKAKSYGINNERNLKTIVDSKQKEFWKLNALYQTMDVKPSAGKVLIDLGLRESKF